MCYKIHCYITVTFRWLSFRRFVLSLPCFHRCDESYKAPLLLLLRVRAFNAAQQQNETIEPGAIGPRYVLGLAEERKSDFTEKNGTR